jgi:C4-dicarboxylate-specific signal transduction histidine kinase
MQHDDGRPLDTAAVIAAVDALTAGDATVRLPRYEDETGADRLYAAFNRLAVSLAQPASERFESPGEKRIETITRVMLSIAAGQLEARVPRAYDGGVLDTLAFLVNATAEETAHLIEQLERERRELERTHEQLVQAAKLVALGELAGGIAHELNQPLTVLEALAQIMLRRPGMRIADHAGQLELMQQATRRMARIVDQVRTFARQTPFQSGALDPLLPLREALALLSHPLQTDGIEVMREVDDELPAIVADSDRLQQVLINLLWNARDAVMERHADAPALIRVEVRRDGRSVLYAIEDSGPGVAEELRSRIFDPFFTTKVVGKGTGLGLSVSHGIVEQHGGRLRYEPAQKGGARFVFDIPIEERAGG